MKDTKKELYDFYDQIVNSIYLNVCAERNNAGEIILWDFQQTNPTDRLYFNVAAAASDIYGKNIYLNMPFIEFVKFAWKRRKVRKNLCWVSPRLEKALPSEAKTSVYLIMEYVANHYGITMDEFEKINDTYYGWYE